MIIQYPKSRIVRIVHTKQNTKTKAHNIIQLPIPRSYINRLFKFLI